MIDMKEMLKDAWNKAFQKGETLSSYPLDIRVTRFDETGNWDVWKDMIICTQDEFDSFFEFFQEKENWSFDAEIFENITDANSAFCLDAGFRVENGVISNY